MNKDELMTVNTVAKMTGITIRTLHYYGEIELLSPSCVSSAKYRFYSNQDLDRLQQILFFKEVGFNLKEIKAIMSAPVYNKEEALKKHVEILVLKRKRIDELIELINKALKGESKINFSVFNENKIIELQRLYHQEALERWENTTAYQQYKNKYSGMEKGTEFSVEIPIIASTE
jgi:DNA-binding transcriptional MerR regulator